MRKDTGKNLKSNHINTYVDLVNVYFMFYVNSLGKGVINAPSNIYKERLWKLINHKL